MVIGNFSFNDNSECFIIAELSANHNGSFQVAMETVKAAKRAGANAIKLQTYRADTITLNVKSGDFIINQGTIWDGKSFYELYEEAFTPWEWHKDLMDLAREEGLICFSSPFDKSAVDFLETLNVPAYKIASFEITDIPLIKYVASKGKPVILSTGIATEEDIQLALNTCRQVGNNDLALLKCTSAYPAKIENSNLEMIQDLSSRFDVVSGLSDHTLGIIAPVVAVTLGAKIIEKHFILNKEIGGPDSSFSLDEEEFSMMVKAVRSAEASIGEIDYSLSNSKKKNRQFSRSLYVAEPIKRGEVLTEKNTRSVRPGFGLHPQYFEKVLGMRAKRDMPAGTPLTFEDLMK